MVTILSTGVRLEYAVAAGAASWFLFHKRPIRGDYAFLAHLFTFLCLYAIVRASLTEPSGHLYVTSALSAVYVASAVIITLVYRLSPWHPLASYPGPWYAKATSLWLSYISFWGKRYLILDRLHAQYGPYLRIGPYHVSINSPSATSVYLTMDKSDSYRYPGHDGAVALFFKQDTSEAHRVRKRVWTQLFTPSGLAALVPVLERRTWQLLLTLERRQSATKSGYVDFPETMYHWSHDFMGDMVFGGCNKLELMRNGDERNLIHLGKIATALLDSVGQTPWLMDILWHIPLSQNLHRMERTAAAMMQTRIKSSEPCGFRDLASYLMESGLTQRELETDAIVAIIGGSDNTSITVSLCIYFLLSNPEYYHQLRKELADAFPDPTGLLSMQELTSLPLLNGAIHETLRLASPYFLPRVVPPGGTHIDGKYLPAGTVVALAAHSQQTSATNFFPEPHNFHPERWEPNGLGPQTKTNKGMLASFSYGTHYCIGKPLAFQEMRYALARLLLAFDMELPAGFDVEGFRGGILNMRTMFLEKKLYVKLKRRPGVDLEAALAAAVDEGSS